MPDPVKEPVVIEGDNVAEVIQNIKEPDAKHTITVDGVDSEVSLEELKALAQKGKSSDDRFRSADALRKAAEQDTKDAQYHRAMLETVKRAKTPGPEQAQGLRDMAANYPEFGISKEDAETVIANIAAKEATVAEDSKTNETAAVPPTFDELPERVQKSVETQENAVRQTNLTTVRNSMRDTLDNDEVLRTILVGKRKDTRTARLLDHAMTILSQKVTQAGRYTPDAVRAAVEETRAFVKDIGLLDVDSPAPGSPLGLGRGPTTPFGSLAKSGSPPPRISPKDALDSEKYAHSVLERLEYQALQDSEE